jgi:hypothetical protein
VPLLRPEGHAGCRVNLFNVARAELVDRHLDGRAVAEFRMREGEELARRLGILPHILRERHDMGDAGRPLALRGRELTGPSAALVRPFGHDPVQETPAGGRIRKDMLHRLLQGGNPEPA